MAEAKKHSTQHIVQTEMFIEGQARPGDSKAQAEARAYLRRIMTEHPKGTRKTKPEHRADCKEQFNIGRREFERIWREEVAYSGAVAFRRRGPRDPGSGYN